MPTILFEKAKIYFRNGDLTKNWYVSYKFFDMKTCKMKQYKSQGKGFLDRGVNNYPDYNTRMYNLILLQERVNNWLIEGNGPVEIPVRLQANVKKPEVLGYAINEVLKNKKAYLKKESYKTLYYHIGIFIKWIKENGLYTTMINDFKVSHAMSFLTYLSNVKEVSNRTRNNYQTDCFNTFNYFNECGFTLFENPFGKIKRIPVRSEQHLLYNKSEFKRVSHYLKENDPYMRLFIIFIICGLRPNEIVNIQLKDIDEEEGVIRIWANSEKTGVPKFKKIHDIYLDDLISLKLYTYPGTYYLFSTKDKPFEKQTTRDYFTKRFKKIKDKLGLNRWHTQYSFRHTTAIDLFKNGADLKQIMAVTGHTSLDGLQTYLQQHLNTKPEDISEKLSLKI